MILNHSIIHTLSRAKTHHIHCSTIFMMPNSPRWLSIQSASLGYKSSPSLKLRASSSSTSNNSTREDLNTDRTQMTSPSEREIDINTTQSLSLWTHKHTHSPRSNDQHFPPPDTPTPPPCPLQTTPAAPLALHQYPRAQHLSCNHSLMPISARCLRSSTS